jgi:hypothetical protein
MTLTFYGVECRLEKWNGHRQHGAGRGGGEMASGLDQQRHDHGAISPRNSVAVKRERRLAANNFLNLGGAREDLFFGEVC